MKIIIAGGRAFNDYELLKKECDKIIHQIFRDISYMVPIEIVSGGARGADKLGERYAEERSFPVKVFNADWDKHGKAAGYLRNAEMAEYAHVLIAFWDGESKGTGHMINLAREKGLQLFIIRYDAGRIQSA